MTVEKFSKTGLHIGQAEAPVKVISFVNLRCPFCANWHLKAENSLEKHVVSGHVEHIIKFYDKPKPSLEIGNHAHHFIDNEDEAAIKVVDSLFRSQAEWGKLTPVELTTYLETNFKLHELAKAKATAQVVIDEANAHDIVSVPTIYIGDQVFDSQVTQEQLESAIAAQLRKG
ncbi:thioredoxin domain-containing protein [Brochothrix campestris]|uniref:Thioredoxin superfamily protein n=1 Tax=Brochothrix campestris FSL F6-1037 TaxID=1265861 RepID=W7CI90_9LIST|nr:thioredoxin domain-containing protein [Brochothrix campestris]EUJ39104.1 thioredoxin superfamily protein [Brochothrix campestris FSL F6-1037]